MVSGQPIVRFQVTGVSDRSARTNLGLDFRWAIFCIGGCSLSQQLGPFQSICNYAEQTDSNEGQADVEAVLYRLQYSKLIREMPHLNHVRTFYHHAVRKETSCENQPETCNRALPQGQNTSREWCCKCESNRQYLLQTVIISDSKQPTCIDKAPPKTAQNAESEDGKTDRSFGSFVCHRQDSIARIC